MKSNKIMNWRRWLILLVAAGLLIGGGYLIVAQTSILAQNRTNSEGATDTSSLQTVTIQAADLAQMAVSAGGNLTLVAEHPVALSVAGVVQTLAVAVGDQVQAGDLLLKLDTTDLQQAVEEAQLSVEAAKIALAEVETPATAAELAQAEAALTEAQENLADVQAGPSAAEVAAARSSLAAAQASYGELTAAPSDTELTQLSADLKKAEIALAEAQRSYDKVAWRNDVGMTAEAATLQEATITYESAKAAYAESTAPAGNADLQTSLSNIQSAQAQLDSLVNSPTAAEIATAQAQVTEAEAALAELKTGATTNEIRNAEITLQQALIALASAQRNLAAATVTAPVAGTVIALEAEVGVRSAADSIVVTLADTSQLELVIGVAEADMPNVALGQQAEIEIDALPGQTFSGIVQAINPVNDSSASSVSYPVTVRLTDANLTNVLPGMNAVATLISGETLPANSWLVPTNALVKTGDVTTVTVVRGTTTATITVTPGAVQGEWTLVQSADLQAGDAVVGSVTSDQDNNSGFPGGGMMPAGGMGGPPR